jgi:ketosteroid isomerase-like protein
MTNRTEDSLASLRQTLSDFRAAVNAGDGAGIYNITAEDFELITPGQSAVTAEAARKFLSSLVTDFKAELKPFANEQLIVCGDYAIQRYTYHLTLTPKSGGAPMVQQGDGLHIFRRDAAGNWRLAKDVFTNVAAAAAAA